MNYWLLLADPKVYGFDQLVKDKKTTWDGISGSLAQKHMRSFKKGDLVLIYHTAPDKAVASHGYATAVGTGSKLRLRSSSRSYFPVPVAVACFIF